MNSNWSYSPEMPKWVKIVDCVVSRDLEVWRVALKYNRRSLLCYCQICASFHSHQWIQTGDTLRKRSIRVKIGAFMSHVTLKFDGRPRKNKAYLLCCFKFCASFNSHQLIQSGVTFRKSSSWVKIGNIWSRMNLKNNRAAFLCYCMLCIISWPSVN